MWYTYLCSLNKTTIMEVYIMKKFECTACGYIYDEELGDPDNGVAPGTCSRRLGLPSLWCR